MSDQEPKATGTKFSQFTVVEGDGIQGVGLKDGQNVRFNLTTDAVAVNPNQFRNARGQFAPTPQELENINNQRDVNEFLYGRIENIEAGEIPPGTIVSEDPPENPEEGLCWYDTGRLELFVYAEGAWLPCSPLGARVDAGEALQAQILARVEAGEAKQATIESSALKTSGNNTVDTSWRVKSDGKTIMSGAEAGKIKIYHLAEPTDGDHAATKSYVDSENADNAKKNESNTFKEVQTFQKASYFQGALVLNGKNTDTLTEVKGENEETRELWNKIRGTNKVSWICYPGQENRDYQRCLTMEWDVDTDKPNVTIDWLTEPTRDRHAATKQYVDQKVSEAGGGSFAQSGATTPDLSTGELFFNTTDKVLYIGE